MKERRNAGATHSFRLTMKAARIVDDINHPRRLGGKSRKISDAIEWYFTPRKSQPSYEDLLANIEGLQNVISSGCPECNNAESGSNRWGWRQLFRRLIGQIRR